MRLRLEDQRIIRLSPNYEPVGLLDDSLGGFDFGITVFVDRSTNTGTLPSCVTASAGVRNLLMLGFVRPAGRGSAIWLNVIEMSENTRGE